MKNLKIVLVLIGFIGLNSPIEIFGQNASSVASTDGKDWIIKGAQSTFGTPSIYVKGNSTSYGDLYFSTGFRPEISKFGSMQFDVFKNFNVNMIGYDGDPIVYFSDFNSTLKFGISTTTPEEKLHVKKGSFLLDAYNDGNEKGIYFREGFNSNNIYNLSILAYDHLNGGTSPDGLSINAYDGISFSTGSNTRNERVRITRDGNLGIGTIDPGSWKLAVNGDIRAKEIKVETNWSDFVFQSNYDLPTLEEVENHIAEKGHLKDIPSAKDVEENGIFLGEMDAKLLQKIEELILYTIAQEKKIKTLEVASTEVEKLKEKIRLQDQKLALILERLEKQKK